MKRRTSSRIVPIAALLSVALGASGVAATARAADTEPPPPEASATAEARWQTLRAHYFADREIVAGDALLSLEAPRRAHDAAVVPIAVHALEPGTTIEALHLIVDQNPLPLAGIFRFAEEARGWRTLETRIRINEYTNVRALAELADGRLAMVTRFVKASGGCSAPAMGDLDAALARAGRMQLLLDEANAASVLPADGASPAAGEPVDAGGRAPLASATIKISHPNNSGMQFDQISRNYIPAFFVERIEATVDGRPLLAVETNFSLSEKFVSTASSGRPSTLASMRSTKNAGM